MKKIWNKIKFAFHSLFWGMKSADVTIMESSINGTGDNAIERQMHTSQNVYSDLLQTKETQEVKELRDETYRVYIEAGHYEVIGDIKTDESGTPYFTNIRGEKKSLLDITPENIYMKKEDELVTIQDNWLVVKGSVEAMDDFFKNSEDADAGIDRYKIKITRDYVPRFRIEKYTSRIVIKKEPPKYGMKDRMIVEFYCTKYPRQFNKEDVFFIEECKRLLNGEKKSDVIDFDEIEFVTEKAFMLDDIHLFKFGDIKYLDTIEFDGKYIIRFSAFPYCNYLDMTAEFRMKEVDEKYKNKKQKSDTFQLNPFTTNMVTEESDPTTELLNNLENNTFTKQ